MGIRRETLTGLILTGGDSTRMGQPKATLTLAGQPMWRHAAAILAQFTDNILLIGSVGEFVPPPPYRLLPDNPVGCGPLGGLLTGLTNSETEHNLVLAVDYPLARPELLRLCLERATDVLAVCGRSKSFVEPLVAYYNQGCCPVIKLMIEEGEIRTHKLIERVPSVILSDEEFERADPDRLSQFNVNNPEDLQRAETMLARESNQQESSI